MYCSKCGKENDNTGKFCGNCGEKIEIKEQVQNINIKNNKKMGSTNLSIISLIFCILQFAATFIASEIPILEFLYNIPWVLISLVLAIISRCKYKDTMSLVLIIIDSILIILMIIGVIILLWFFSSLFEIALTGCGQLS